MTFFAHLFHFNWYSLILQRVFPQVFGSFWVEWLYFPSPNLYLHHDFAKIIYRVVFFTGSSQKFYVLREENSPCSLSNLCHNRWKLHWIFWVGPGLGGATAALTHQLIYAQAACDIFWHCVTLNVSQLDQINHSVNRNKRRKYKGSFEATPMDTTEGATLVLKESPYFRCPGPESWSWSVSPSFHFYFHFPFQHFHFSFSLSPPL